MFKLHVVQAKYGDALILSFGTSAKPRHILIDGGPSGNYAADLEPAAQALPGCKDLLVDRTGVRGRCAGPAGDQPAAV